MKKFNQNCFVIAFVVVCFIQVNQILVYGNTYLTSNIEITTNEIDQLRSDINYIDNIDINILEEYYENNKAWFEDVDNRLAEFFQVNSLNDIYSRESQLYLLPKLELLHNINLQTDIGSDQALIDLMDIYFKFYDYILREELWTISLDPKISTRVLKTRAILGWAAVREFYPTVINHYNSLYDQYMCHFYIAKFKDKWNIEEGRPDVGIHETIKALCNP